MKKFYIIFGILCMTVMGVSAAEQQIQPKINHVKPITQQERAQKVAAFEQRLGLTDAQKLKAKEIRTESHEQMRPIIMEIKTKKQEMEAVKKSRMAIQAQEEKLAELEVELNALEKKAKKIRKASMKKFENLLTFKQRRILKEMKREGRQKYQAMHMQNK